MELKTQRLIMRKIVSGDFEDICSVLMDPQVMYAWEHGFSEEEVREWIDNTLRRYERDGFGHLAVRKIETQEFVGLIGPLIEELEGTAYIGIGYILKKDCRHRGYAYEGAKAAMDYAFCDLRAEKVIADIRPNNISSRRVAEKLGMTVQGEIIKVYNGKQMPHLLYMKRCQ